MNYSTFKPILVIYEQQLCLKHLPQYNINRNRTVKLLGCVHKEQTR